MAINCITISCIEIPDEAECVDGTILSVTVSNACVSDPKLIINGGTRCIAGGVNTLELTGCCGSVLWKGITAVGHNGTAVILDPTVNPTQFTTSARGSYEFQWDCCS